MSEVKLIHGDCLAVLPRLEANSIDAVVTDPPAGIAFMGKHWDHDKGGRDEWVAWMEGVARECLRVLKPGAHALVWALPRTSHWTATAWENAGFEVRDRVEFCFGSGFPKSLDVSKAIDREAGAEREIIFFKGTAPDIRGNSSNGNGISSEASKLKDRLPNYTTAPTTDAARRWQGWGTALKPAIEDWWLLRKPLSEKTVAANVLKWGTGAMNVDGCRIGMMTDSEIARSGKSTSGMFRPGGVDWKRDNKPPRGRFPSHLIHDGSEEVKGMFPMSGPPCGSATKKDSTGRGVTWSQTLRARAGSNADFVGDSGSASRFFKACPFEEEDFEAARLVYMSKASKADRDEGCNDLEARRYSHDGRETPIDNAYQRNASKAHNHHPTVKSTPLMRYLCRLITPPQGTVLDPFMGSGSTGKACVLEAFNFIGIEAEAEYMAIARARIDAAQKQGRLI